jgi:hypothetical protein
MANRNKKQIKAAIDGLASKVADAFRRVMAKMAGSVSLSEMVRAIKSGDIEGAVRMIRSEPRIWGEMDAETQNVFSQGGFDQVGELPPVPPGRGSFFAAFSMRNRRAEDWIRERSSKLIVQIQDDLRSAVRGTILAGVERGRGAVAIAKGILGAKVDSATREGGTLGLHSQFADAVDNARDELATPKGMVRYLTRKRRDKRFDKLVKNAIKDGRSLTAGEVSALTQAYSSRLLDLRSQAIARTETNRAYNAGRMEATAQNIESGVYPAEAVELTWVSTIPSPRTRETHVAMDGQKVKWGKKFVTPTGVELLHPCDISGDPSGQDPRVAAETINCRCTFTVNVKWASAYAAL